MLYFVKNLTKNSVAINNKTLLIRDKLEKECLKMLLIYLIKAT